MPNTKNYGFPLYDPEESPDLTTTGREAEAVIAIDAALKNEEDERTAGDAELNAVLEKETAERQAADKVLTDNLAKEVADRKAADTALGGRIDAEATARETADTALGGRIDAEAAARETADTALGGRIDAEAAARGAADTALGGRIDAEATAREAADTALGGRIDNAETEISANSADLTGIKGLTYGNDHVAFLENNNGEYDSPALQEIEEQIAAGKLNVAIYGVTTFNEVKAMLPNVICKNGDNFSQFCYADKNAIHFFRLGFASNHELLWVTSQDRWERGIQNTAWSSISHKPFNTVGTGLNTASESLSLDTSYLPTVSAGSGVTVTPTTDGNHTKYEISSTGGGGGTGSVSWPSVTDKPFNSVGTGLNTASESLSLDTSYLPTVSAGSGVTVTPITDGNHTKYEISSTGGGGGTGGITGDTTWAEMEA